MTWPATAADMRDALHKGEVSSVELVDRALAAIDDRDGDIKAFLSLADRDKLVAEARRIDRLRKEGAAPSPFAGVPVAVKDNIAVKAMPLTCGSRILEPYVPPYDATAVERLRAAGLIILGKTNMDEFGFGSSTENSAFQVTRNPRALDRVPGGTSGGSAAAVAAGYVPWALGTDTGGSVRQPAALCGTVGIRPTYGRVSRYGLVAYASSLDQIGTLAGTVEDAADLLSIVMGPDQRDSTSLPDRPGQLTRQMSSLRVGIPDEYLSPACQPEIVDAVRRTADRAVDLGWSVTPVSLPSTDLALAAYYLIASVEAASNLARYDGVKYGHRAADASSWEDMVASSRAEGFGPEAKRRIMLGTFAASAGYADRYYLQACRAREVIRREFAAVFEAVDVLLTPVSPTTAWPIGERTTDPMTMYLSDVFSVPVPLASVPAVVIPAGRDHQGLPIGVQIAAGHGNDATAITAALALEQRVRDEVADGPGVR